MKAISRLATRSFVGFVILAAVLGFVVPPVFSWVGVTLVKLPVGGTTVDLSFVHVGLGLIMLGMGMTLSIPDVVQSLKHPHWILLGVLAQFLIMPAAAFGLSVLLGLEAAVAAGVILVGCCPGGTASNVIAFLSRADVPLSVSVTLASTFLAPLLTPWLTWFYAQYLLGFYSDQIIHVPVVKLMAATGVIVGPIVIGLLIKQVLWGDEPVPVIKNLFTLFSILVIALLVAYIVGSGKESIVDRPWQALFLFVPVMLHNALGLGLGFGAGKLFNLPLDSVRSLSIEVGMQNSGLGLALAGLLVADLKQWGTVDPSLLALIPLPAVLFSFWHNLTGSVLASYWRSRREGDDSAEEVDRADGGFSG